MANVNTNAKDIKYLNKDFTDFKSALIEYAKAYFPANYNDFSTPSPGTMFIEMASYVGDVLSFYLDNQLQETFLQYAKQKDNLYTMAYMLGYRPRVTSAAVTTLNVYQIVPSKGTPGNYTPDFNYALIIDKGMRVNSTVTQNSINNPGSTYYVPDEINFAASSSLEPTTVSIYQVDNNGDPLYYLLSKTVKAYSGTPKSTQVTFGVAEKFSTTLLRDENIIEVTSVYDSNGNQWYEVPYLAQDHIMKAVQNVPPLNPDYAEYAGTVPYILELMKVPRRFVTRFRTDESLELQFGAGVNELPDEVVTPMPGVVGRGTIDSLSKLNVGYDPANFTATETYGLAPSNTTLTINYTIGGGANANVGVGELNQAIVDRSRFYGGVLDINKSTVVRNSIAVTNITPGYGGGDGDTVEQLRQNTLNQYPSQMRAVTQQDYLAFAYNMPSKFGEIAKAYIMKDDVVYKQNLTTEDQDPLAASIYILAYNNNKNLIQAPDVLKQNLKTYISQYRMLTDSVNIKDAYVINIGVSFDIILRPNYASTDVLSQCIIAVQDYFKVEKWDINQPIIMSEIYTLLDQVVGVQTVQKVYITNIAGTGNSANYSEYSYDIPGATLNGVIYPSLDPSIFEVRYPNIDITGRVVTY